MKPMRALNYADKTMFLHQGTISETDMPEIPISLARKRRPILSNKFLINSILICLWFPFLLLIVPLFNTRDKKNLRSNSKETELTIPSKYYSCQREV